MLCGSGTFVSPLLFISEALLKFYLSRCHPMMALWDKLIQEEAFIVEENYHNFCICDSPLPNLSQSFYLAASVETNGGEVHCNELSQLFQVLSLTHKVPYSLASFFAIPQLRPNCSNYPDYFLFIEWAIVSLTLSHLSLWVPLPLVLFLTPSA